MAIVSSGDTKLGGTSHHISIDPSRTYLRTNGDAALGAIPIDLVALNILAGDVLFLQETGDYDADGSEPNLTDSSTAMTAVFSTSGTLGASSLPNRVSGAVAANNPVLGGQLPAVITEPTLNGGIPTDISQDFEVFGGTSDDLTVTRVPTGAGFLFVSPLDSSFFDNTDPDNDFGINIYRPMVVGLTGIGSATITGNEYRDTIAVGAATGSNGTLLIQGGAVVDIGGALAPDLGGETVNGTFRVGLKGTGSATISGGSVVTVDANGTYSNVVVGQYQGGVGTVTVTGVGSELISQGIDNGIYIGREGTGTLNILAGGLVQTLSLSVARHGTGTVNVTGVGSHLVVSNELGGYSDYAGQAGGASFGARTPGATGMLNVTAGGVFDIISAGPEENPQLRFGRNIGAIGIGVVDGAGSQINVTQAAPGSDYYTGPRLLIGVQGDGTLTVRNGGVVNVIGEHAELIVSAAGQVDGNEPLALLSQSELLIQTGGVVTVDRQGTNYESINVGNHAFGNGAIRISGISSKLVSAGVDDEIVIGNQGTGILTVGVGGAGAEVLGQRIFVGFDDGSTGTVTVDGINSKITLTSPDDEGGARLWVGNRGNGTMTVSNSASVSMTGVYSHLFVGDGYGLSAPGGNGLLTIQSGGQVTVTNTDTVNQSGNIDIGVQEFGNGTVTVTGAGSTLTAVGTEPYIGVGNQGTGVLNVLSGGKVVSLFMNVGSEDSSQGTLNIAGAGSKVVLSNDTHTEGFNGDVYGGFLTVGNQDGSSGIVNITAGGVLEIRNSISGNENAPGLQLGNQQGSVGVVTVDGAGSAINVSQVGGVYGYERGGAFVQVGRIGDGTLTVRNNAQLNITGEYGLFRVSRGNNDDDIGAPSRAELSEAFIQSGADVTLNMTGGSYYGAVAMLAARSNANGRLTIDGTGSTLNVLANNIGTLDSERAALLVAQHGMGDLVVTNAADVFVNGGDDKRPILAVGQAYNSIGSLSITGAGSTINLLTTNVDTDGGGLITVGRWSGSSGVMNILSGAQVINDLGSTNSAMTVGQSGEYNAYAASEGQVIVDGNGIAATLLDAGQLLVVGGSWSGADSTLASVDFDGGGTGSVLALDAAIVRANIIAVGSGGTLGGNSTFDGSVTVDGGTIAPGASPGILTITGALTLTEAVLNMEVNGLTAGTQYDQIKVAGAVTMGEVDLNIVTGGAFNFADGNRLLLIDGSAGLTVTDMDQINVQITGEPGSLAYQIGDEGSDFVFEALNNGSGAALVSFGAASLIAANATISEGAGSGTGGKFDDVQFVNATGLEGTAAGDIFTASGSQAVTLLGLGGSDTLTGADGSDTIDGGAGIDSMTGGLGGDTYAVDNVGDVVDETGGDGTDVVNSAITFSLADGVHVIGDIENLTLTGALAINGTGNAAINTITGNSAANIIDGGAGADIMAGGLGNDTYVVDDAGDSITDTGGTDLVKSSISYSLLGTTVENLTLTGSDNIDATGTALANILTGNTGNNVLDGLGGIDTMVGGLGDDTYVVDVAGDVVTELAGVGTGTDTIEVASTFAAVAGVVTYSIAAKANVENLTYLGTNNFTGTGNTLNNIITGGDGNDILDGGAGLDTLVGGDGNDTYTVATLGDTVDETGGSGTDLVKSAINFSLVDGAGQVTGEVENLTLTGALAINGTGNASINTIIGNTGANVIEGGDAADRLDGAAGIDTVSYASSDTGVTVTLNGAVITVGTGGDAQGDQINNFENIIGSDHIDTLTGDGLANVIDGGAGADIMAGGLGNDTYVVDDAGDSITDTGGTDLVKSSISYSLLGTTVENLTLTGSDNIDATGTALANILTGNTGNNVLDGLGGIDTMVGGLGDDTYVVDVAGDVVTELAGVGTGTDTIEVASTFAAVAGVVTYSIAAKANVENLTYLGTNNFTGTGNTLNNIITGGDGNDILDGGAGLDTLVGGDGNDTYTVATLGDTVDETGGSGTDLVKSAINFSLVDGAGQVTGEVENLTLTGALAINGTGNASINTIIGNTGANVIEGGDAADRLDGAAGIDTVSYASSDTGVTVTLNGAVITVGTGGDAQGDQINNFENIIGSDHIDTLTGDGLANVIDGGAGADIMAGGLGNDTYVVDDAGDSITDTGGTDLVKSSISYSLLGTTVENLTLTGSDNIDATGTALANILTGNTGNNVLDGLGGIDTMVGGLGDDTYVVDVAGDVVTELAGVGTGTDTIEVASTFAAVAGVVTYSIAAKANVENLTYLGTNNFTGTGNTLNNIITGGDGNDILDGGAGLDTLVGGDGNDTYTVATLGDTVDETGGSGTDLVKSAINFSLVDGAGQVTGEVENLTLTGALAINGTGNASINTIIGNTGANVIEGGDAADRLDGAAGIDTVSYASSDTGVTVTLNGAVITVGTGGDAQGDQINNFENIIGSDHIDTLTGDGLANVIDGGAGADIMAGGLGNDTYVVDDAGDSITDTGGTDLVKSSISYSLLGTTVENLTLTGSDNIDATGTALANILTGNTGNNVLDGLGGIDTMVGGLGDDTYVVDVAGDVVTELAGVGTGTDTIEVASTFAAVAGVVTYSIAAKANVENLTYLGTNNFTGTGNTLNNIITGGDGADKLNGGAGADSLIGGAGDDTLTGGTQNDQFIFKDFVLAGDFGNDKITDFAGGVGLGDVIQIDDAWGFATEADVLAAFHVVGADQVLTVGADSITLVGKAGLVLNVDDFLII